MKTALMVLALLLCAVAVNAQSNSTSMANPASVYCAGEGYKETAKGCVFPDGKSCNPWDFLRGKCGQKYTSCAQKGFKVNSKTQTTGTSKSQIGVCIFPDRKECELMAFQKGTCKYNAPVVIPSTGSRDLAQYMAEKRAMKYSKPACKKEGEPIPVIANPPQCCAGLNVIKPMQQMVVGIKGICTSLCGNFKCDSQETKYNCPRDCKK